MDEQKKQLANALLEVYYHARALRDELLRLRLQRTMITIADLRNAVDGSNNDDDEHEPPEREEC